MQRSEWIVFKFGGTSMNGAEKIANVSKIVTQRIFNPAGKRVGTQRLAVVVSRMAPVKM